MICVIASLAAAPVGMLAGNDAIKSMAVREVRQNGSRVTGLVTDTKGEPLPGVSIYVKSMKGGCLTDVNGRFSLPVPKDGTYDLEVSLVGMCGPSARGSACEVWQTFQRYSSPKTCPSSAKLWSQAMAIYAREPTRDPLR